MTIVTLLLTLFKVRNDFDTALRNEVDKVLNKEIEKIGVKNVESENRLKVVEQISNDADNRDDHIDEMVFNRRDIVEQIEIDKRKGNLIFMGMGEGVNEREVVNKILIELEAGNGEGVIGNIERIGERKENKTRPVRVSFRSAAVRGNVLRNAVKLRETEYKDVYVSPDLTPKQQVKDRDLRQKLKEIRTNVGEGVRHNIKIKQGKIVKNLNGREEILFPPSRTTRH